MTKLNSVAVYKIGCVYNEVTMLYGMKDTYIQMKNPHKRPPKSYEHLSCFMMVWENLL